MDELQAERGEVSVEWVLLAVYGDLIIIGVLTRQLVTMISTCHYSN
jgi:hypothetical protein